MKQSHMSRVSHFQPGFRACLRALVTFGFLMLKYASCHIVDTLFLSFLIASSTPKTNKNSTSHSTSFNLRYSYILDLISNLHEKVMSLIVWLFDLMRYAKWCEARKFYDLSGENSKIIWLVAQFFSQCLQSGNLYFKTDKKSAVHLFSCYKKWKP